jgi:hypothetical protein
MKGLENCGGRAKFFEFIVTDRNTTKIKQIISSK